MERKLLDLAVEYMNYDTMESTLHEFHRAPDRTRDDIAAEYGQVLKQFLAG